MAYISNQWLKGGKEWFPVYTKLELDNSDFADYELTLRKEVGIYKCMNIDCLNNEEKEFELTDNDIDLNNSQKGVCLYCSGELSFIEKKPYTEHQTIFIDKEEGEEIVNLITGSFNDEKSSKLLSKLIVKLSDKSKLDIIREILDNR